MLDTPAERIITAALPEKELSLLLHKPEVRRAYAAVRTVQDAQAFLDLASNEMRQEWWKQKLTHWKPPDW